MTDGPPAQTATIDFQYERSYRVSVEDGDPDSWIAVAIAIGDTYIWGGPNSGVTGFACGIVLNLLETVDAALLDERYVVEFEWGPSWMVVEPRNDASVTVSRASTLKGARNPDERLEVDTARPVTKRAWIEEVVDTAREFHGTILEMNPDLRTRGVMQQLRRKIRRAERLSAADDDTVN